jgi:hypothetical protein
MTVWKFQVSLDAVNDHVFFQMPRGAIPLSVGNQDEMLTVWALVDPKRDSVTHEFRVAGTGHSGLSPKRVFLGTAQFRGGALVLHVFDVGEV